ncbi:MAG TPA: hypothetical protein VFW68_02145 [Rhodocyclaceae bacterium]|nr:hypothetical protein [Rhodocyclaceae bacterium]
MTDLQVLILLALGIAVGAYLPRLARWVAQQIHQRRYRPRMVRRHSIAPKQQQPSDSEDA